MGINHDYRHLPLVGRPRNQHWPHLILMLALWIDIQHHLSRRTPKGQHTFYRMLARLWRFSLARSWYRTSSYSAWYDGRHPITIIFPVGAPDEVWSAANHYIECVDLYKTAFVARNSCRILRSEIVLTPAKGLCIVVASYSMSSRILRWNGVCRLSLSLSRQNNWLLKPRDVFVCEN